MLAASTGRGVMTGVRHSEADKLHSGLISGGSTPICALRYKPGEALFKGFLER